MPLPQRKHPARGVLHRGNQPTIIFDTVCTKDRHPWLAHEDVHAILREVWMQADAWRMGRYMVMPDHIHYFSGCTGRSTAYKAWVTYWKSQFSRRFKRADCRWQVGHWDTRIRSIDADEEKWRYVLDNPVRGGLVSRHEDWPFQGEIHVLRWD